MLAARIVDNGAGARLRFDRATSNDLHHAITTVLREPDYHTQAARLRRSLHDTDGARSAADLLESTAQ
jgi:UDP:flavonoid glycosyltransferase YjiC (YdhE family)